MTTKKDLGQFYTTNNRYILNRMVIPDENHIIEPFAGNGDLIDWCGESIESYDIHPKRDDIIQRDVLLYPPNYNNKFVITNPPYLARNKNNDKTIYDMYMVNDLYKAFIISIIDGGVSGGILILPLNFLCSKEYRVRDYFLSNYHIERLNIFEESVFDDTSYTICVFDFYKGYQRDTIDAVFYPSQTKLDIRLESRYKWLFGGDLFPVIRSSYKIGRLMKGQTPTTNIRLHTVDTGSMDGRIRLSLNPEPFYGKITDRSMATISTNIPIDDEQYVVDEFNRIIEICRNKYRSMFLNTFRNSTIHYVRKRIGFTMSYNIIKMILENKTHHF